MNRRDRPRCPGDDMSGETSIQADLCSKGKLVLASLHSV